LAKKFGICLEKVLEIEILWDFWKDCFGNLALFLKNKNRN